MQQGDAPYTKYLADNYAISDYHHQPTNGGTGANRLVLGFADTLWFTDADNNATVPLHNQMGAFRRSHG